MMSSVIEIPLNSSPSGDEEVRLESSDSLENAVPHTQLTELSQVSLLKSYNAHFTLFNGHFLSVYFKTFFSRPKRYWLDLAYLEPIPRRILKIDRPSLYATVILSLASVVLVLTNAFTNDPLKLLPATIAVICSTLIALLLLIYRSTDRVVFYTRYGRVNWLEFLINKPNRRAYREFVEKIGGTIHAVSNRQSSRHEQRLGAELREHRRLRDAGILSPKVYEDVKRRFLNQHVHLRNTYSDDSDLKQNKEELDRSNLKHVSGKLLAVLAEKIAAIRAGFNKPESPVQK